MRYAKYDVLGHFAGYQVAGRQVIAPCCDSYEGGFIKPAPQTLDEGLR